MSGHLSPVIERDPADNPQLLLSADARQQMQQMFQPYGSQAGQIYDQVMEAMKLGLAEDVHSIFLVSTVMMAIALLALFFLEEIPLRGTRAASRRSASEKIGSEMSATGMH